MSRFPIRGGLEIEVSHLAAAPLRSWLATSLDTTSTTALRVPAALRDREPPQPDLGPAAIPIAPARALAVSQHHREPLRLPRPTHSLPPPTSTFSDSLDTAYRRTHLTPDICHVAAIRAHSLQLHAPSRPYTARFDVAKHHASVALGPSPMKARHAH